MGLKFSGKVLKICDVNGNLSHRKVEIVKQANWDLRYNDTQKVHLLRNLVPDVEITSIVGRVCGMALEKLKLCIKAINGYFIKKLLHK